MVRQTFNSILAQMIGAGALVAAVLLAAILVGSQVVRQQRESQALLNAAALQRAEVFRLSELARRLDDAETAEQRESIVSQIREGLVAFDERQASFREGNPQSGIVPIEDELIFATLDDMDAAWQRYRHLLESYTDRAETGNDELLRDITDQSVIVFNFANRLQNAIGFGVDQIQQQARSYYAVLLGVSVLVAISMGVLIYRILLGLNGLRQTAAQLAKGHYDARATTKTYTEVAEVGVVFNQMADAVRERETSLIRARREAEEASRLKDEFLSVMSHELRTPLNAILGYQGVMELMGEMNDENLEMVQRTQANARRLLDLINDVLDISRIESGRMQLVPIQLDMTNFIKQIHERMQVLATGKGLDFNITIADSVPSTAYYDEDALTKIIVNLLANAFKFTEKGQVDLSLAAHDGSMMITIRDTGIGIPTHLQEIIFERFRQVDSSSTRKHGGTGLGLSIVQQLCQLMGGRVTVQSEPGAGSTFTVSLPLHAVPEAMEVTK